MEITFTGETTLQDVCNLTEWALAQPNAAEIVSGLILKAYLDGERQKLEISQQEKKQTL